jgi:hypothetical protein
MRFATLALPNVGIDAVQTTRKICLLVTVAFVCIASGTPSAENQHWPQTMAQHLMP